MRAKFFNFSIYNVLHVCYNNIKLRVRHRKGGADVAEQTTQILRSIRAPLATFESLKQIAANMRVSQGEALAILIEEWENGQGKGADADEKNIIARLEAHQSAIRHLFEQLIKQKESELNETDENLHIADGDNGTNH